MNTHQRRAAITHAACCETLESRRMLAVLDGTSGADEIRISSTGSSTSVTLDPPGTFPPPTTFTTTDLVVTINALGGNDRIYFPRLNKTASGAFPGIEVFLGDGDDTASNVDNNTDTASLVEFDFPIAMSGGAGNDMVVIDGADDTTSRSFVLHMDTPGVNSAGTSGDGLVRYSTVESIEMYGSPQGDSFQLRAKPASVSVTARGENGNDSFRMGNGDLDVTGFSTLTTTAFGGNGTDSIIFADRTDDVGETEAYTFRNLSFLKGTTGISYSTIETQTLETANVGTAANTIHMEAINGTVATTVINGGGNRSCIINVATGDLSTLAGVLNFSLPATLDRVTINDQSPTGPIDYTFDATRFEQVNGQVINFTGVEAMTLNAGAGDSNFAARGTPAGMFLAVNAGAGSDVLLIGNGNIDTDLRGQVVMNAGPAADFDVGIISNDTDSTLATQSLVATSFTDGLTHSFFAVDSLNIFEGPGGTNFTVNSTIVPTTVTGGAGNDAFTVGGGDIDAAIPPSALTSPVLVIDGGQGNDSIRLDDRIDTTVSTLNIYQFQRTGGVDQFQRVRVADHFINWSNIEGVTLDANDSTNVNTFINVVDTTTPIRINGHGGPDKVQILDALVPVTIHTGSGTDDQIHVNHDLDGAPVTAIVDQSDEVETLNVFAAGTLRVTNGATLVKTRAVQPPGALNLVGVLDLAGGALLSRAGGPTPTQLRNQIITGRNGGGWNGSGAGGAINSSLAASTPISDGVGYGLGSQITPTSVGPFSIGASDTLVRYTLDGDTNLDQQVNLADYNRLTANFGQANKQWVDGDSSYDGVVNLSDYNALSGNFGTSVGAELFGGQPIRGSEWNDDPRDVIHELI